MADFAHSDRIGGVFSAKDRRRRRGCVRLFFRRLTQRCGDFLYGQRFFPRLRGCGVLCRCGFGLRCRRGLRLPRVAFLLGHFGRRSGVGQARAVNRLPARSDSIGGELSVLRDKHGDERFFGFPHPGCVLGENGVNRLIERSAFHRFASVGEQKRG